tara:strand:+ start:985 stop:1137 length:153 start_codon:yes stop_codon:yes gene_type:complete
MSKATARKRLDEASMKLFKVFAECDHLTDADSNKLIKMRSEIRRMKKKLH